MVTQVFLARHAERRWSTMRLTVMPISVFSNGKTGSDTSDVPIDSIRCCASEQFRMSPISDGAQIRNVRAVKSYLTDVPPYVIPL